MLKGANHATMSYHGHVAQAAVSLGALCQQTGVAMCKGLVIVWCEALVSSVSIRLALIPRSSICPCLLFRDVEVSSFVWIGGCDAFAFGAPLVGDAGVLLLKRF